MSTVQQSMPAGAAGWNEADEREFTVAVNALNLQRCKFAAIAGSMISLWTCALSVAMPETRLRDLWPWLFTCVSLYAVFFVIGRYMRGPSVSEEVRRIYVQSFAVALIGICDGFFFLLSEQLTSVSSFSRGMLVAGVIFVLPPRRFIPLVVGNELLLCAWLIWRGIDMGTLTAFLDGTAGAVVASVASWMLFAAKRADFRQQRLIRRQHEELNELMAITAHDLRSPLLGVKNLLALALTRTNLERDRLVAVVADAARACDRMLGLVGGLVRAHAAERSGGEASQQGDLRAQVLAAIGRLGATAENAGVRFEARLPDNNAEASFDPEALEQVLDNLLSNALKFAPPGSAIEITLKRESQMWRLEVADDGPGVSEEERPRLFQKYARGTTLGRWGESGTGLGLFIAKTLTERMGGRVGYAPRSPAGACFWVEVRAI